jgi:hypothetical protein
MLPRVARNSLSALVFASIKALSCLLSYCYYLRSSQHSEMLFRLIHLSYGDRMMNRVVEKHCCCWNLMCLNYCNDFVGSKMMATFHTMYWTSTYDD